MVVHSVAMSARGLIDVDQDTTPMFARICADAGFGKQGSPILEERGTASADVGEGSRCSQAFGGALPSH